MQWNYFLMAQADCFQEILQSESLLVKRLVR